MTVKDEAKKRARFSRRTFAQVRFRMQCRPVPRISRTRSLGRYQPG
jgi:hypothetical protein